MTPVPDRVVRTPLVGRTTQLLTLTSALEAAELGERVLVLVSGEPGIGKTRLVREATAGTGARVLWSTCSDSEGAPAFWPWLQLLRALVREADAGQRDAPVPYPRTGPGPEHRDRPGPEHRERLRRLLDQVPSSDVSPDARFRLFDTVADVLAETSRTEPLVLVLDDLHWADEASVRLLEFVASDVRPRRMALLGAYRDTELPADHPLARSLGQLVRTGLHVPLRGLSESDVADLAAALDEEGRGLVAVPAELHRRSGGNPLYLRELLRLREAEGELAPDGGAAVPSGVRLLVARRLAAVSPSTREVLTAGAVIGAEVDVGDLSAVVDRPDGDVRAALDDAAAVGLVEERGAGAGVHFVHDLVRDVLYEESGLAVRAALHRRVADVLAQEDGDARLPELAHHLLHSRTATDDVRVLDYAIRAAEHHLGLLAYEPAATWYGHALDLVRSASPRDAARVRDLLLRRGAALLAAGDLPGARDDYAEAAALARRAGDAEALAQAALGLGSGLGGFEVRLFDPVQVTLLEEALDALDLAPSRLRAWVLARLSVALSFLEDEGRRRALSEEAVAMAREVGDASALGYALAGHCDALAGPDGCDVRLVESAEIVRLARETRDRPLELLGRRLRLVALLEVGDVGQADVELTRFAGLAAQLRQPLSLWYVPLWRGMRALMQGRLDQAAAYGDEAEEVGARAHSDNARLLTFTQWWVRQRYEGRFHEAGVAMAALLGDEPPGAPVTAGARAVAAAQAGDHDAARAFLRQWFAAGLHEGTRDSEWLPETAQRAELAVALGASDVAAVLYRDLQPYADRFCVEGIGAAVTGSVAWYLAVLARVLGHEADADAYETRARAAHARIGLVGDPPPLVAPSSRPGPQAATGPARSATTSEPAPPHIPAESAPSAAPAPSAPAASLVREGATWAVTYAGKTRRLRAGKGLGDLAVLLARPGQEVHCLELVGGVDVGREAGPVLDPQARRAYQQRIRDLQQEIDEARDAYDPHRAERAEAELDALVQQLSEAFGLSGRSRAPGSASERARSAVSWRIRAALRHAAEVHPEFARHLKNSVRTGTWCSYEPETPVAWQIDPGAGRA